MVTRQAFQALPAPAPVRARRLPPPLPAAAGALSLTVHADIAAIEAVWRDLETRSARSVYQRYDWIAPWCEHAAPPLGVIPAVVVGWVGGRAVFLLPFGRHRGGAGQVISWLGGSHVNLGLGLFDRDYADGLDEVATRDLFKRVTKALAPADLVMLCNQPLNWRGTPNPLAALPGRAEDQPVATIALNADFEGLLARTNGAKKRKKLRWQKNTLADVGGYRFVRAASAVEANAYFDAFLAQKQTQFAEAGIENVFADAGTIAFFRALIARAAAAHDPLIELHAVIIDGGIRATFATGIENGHIHGYFSGMSLDEYQRASPGELLLFHLIEESCQRGLREMDLGVGQERYKASWLPAYEPQFATYVGLTLRGRMAAHWLHWKQRTRLRIRNSPRAWAVTKKMRRAFARIGFAR